MAEFVQGNYAKIENEAMNNLLNSYAVEGDFSVRYRKDDSKGRRNFTIDGIDETNLEKIKLFHLGGKKSITLENLMLNSDDDKSWIYVKLTDGETNYIMNLYVPKTTNKISKNSIQWGNNNVNSLSFENNCLHLNLDNDKLIKYDGNKQEFSYNP